MSVDVGGHTPRDLKEVKTSLSPACSPSGLQARRQGFSRVHPHQVLLSPGPQVYTQTGRAKPALSPGWLAPQVSSFLVILLWELFFVSSSLPQVSVYRDRKPNPIPSTAEGGFPGHSWILPPSCAYWLCTSSRSDS